MSSLILPQKWTRQPQVPVEIDWSNPITNRIISVQDASGVDHVTGMGTFTGSARVNKYSPMGQGVLFGADTLTFPLAPYSGTINDSLVWVGSRSLVNWASYGTNNGLGLTANGSNLGIANEHASYTIPNTSWPTGIVVAIGVISGQFDGSLWLNGIKKSTSRYTTPAAQNVSRMSGASDVTGLLSIRYARQLNDSEVASLSNNPWQIFQPLQRRIFVASAGGAAALAGNAAAQASATGSLTTAIPIAAAALSISTASAALSTAIPLSGAAASVASSNGSLTAQIRLGANALAQAIASAGLSSGIILTANAVAQAAAQGTLSTLINLIANAQGSASASASLTAGSGGLSADAQAQATASANLTVQIQLSAAALAQAAASASLTAGSGGLSANALAVATAQGDLTVPIALTAAALAQAFSSGSLVTQIQLVAHASGQVSASGQLQGAALVIDPRYLATLPSRSFTAMLPVRSFTVSHKG